jgi:hypothetical protein
MPEADAPNPGNPDPLERAMAPATTGFAPRSSAVRRSCALVRRLDHRRRGHGMARPRLDRRCLSLRRVFLNDRLSIFVAADGNVRGVRRTTRVCVSKDTSDWAMRHG